MNWLEIYHVMMMKELYDISVLFLRCLREFEKWSWILILRKNEEKWGKIGENSCPRIRKYILLLLLLLLLLQLLPLCVF